MGSNPLLVNPVEGKFVILTATRKVDRIFFVLNPYDILIPYCQFYQIEKPGGIYHWITLFLSGEIESGALNKFLPVYELGPGYALNMIVRVSS